MLTIWWLHTTMFFSSHVTEDGLWLECVCLLHIVHMINSFQADCRCSTLLHHVVYLPSA